MPLKIIPVVLLAFALLPAAFAQDPLQSRVSLSAVNAPVEQLLAEVSEQSNIRFSYNPDILPADPVEGHFANATVKSVLNEALGKDYQYKVRGSYVIIQPAKEKQGGQKADIKFSGQIVDAVTGQRLPNASIYEVHNLTATLSEDDGSYNLSATYEDEVAIFAISRENYQDTIIRISKPQIEPLRIELKPLAQPEQERRRFVLNTDSTKIAQFFVSAKARLHMRNVDLQEHSVVQVSFLPGISTNGFLSGKVSNNFSLNVLAGLGYSVNGVEVAGMVNIDRKDVNGFQLAGFANVAGGRVIGSQTSGFVNLALGSLDGLQLAGFVNTTRESVDGAQIAGFTNLSDSVTGLQLSGFHNHTIGRLNGVQISGFTNISHGDADGLQLSGFLNISGKGLNGSLDGAQIAGFMNTAVGDVDGLQLAGFLNIAGASLNGPQISGFMNLADSVDGLQLGGFTNIAGADLDGVQISGFFNRARVVRGVQIGIVNVAQNVEKGAAIGVFNFVRDGLHKFQVEANDVTPFNLSFRGGTKSFYTLLSAGAKPGAEGLWSAGMGIGTELTLAKEKLYVDLEAASYMLQPLERFINGTSNDYRFSVNLGYHLGSWASVNAGPALHWYHYSSEDGLNDFPNRFGANSFSEVEGPASFRKMWVGYQAAVRF